MIEIQEIEQEDKDLSVVFRRSDRTDCEGVSIPSQLKDGSLVFIGTDDLYAEFIENIQSENIKNIAVVMSEKVWLKFFKGDDSLQNEWNHKIFFLGRNK